ncbi:MAG: leucyl/phenylalanyl-tRNA--protein transferase [Planctomyces sp.]
MPSSSPNRAADPVALLLRAYALGAFPMARSRHEEKVEFFTVDRRSIIPLDAAPNTPGGMHIPASLARRVRSRRFIITADRAFSAVIRACAEPRPPAAGRTDPAAAQPAREDGQPTREGGQPAGEDGHGRGEDEHADDTWINGWIIDAYTALHHAGHAHSIEAWLPEEPAADSTRDHAEPARLRLVGGLYGVRLGAAFFGESMFSRPAIGGTDASKVCLVHLVAHLRAGGFALLDTQFSNPHIARFGPVDLPRARYMQRLAEALALSVPWRNLDPEAAPAMLGAPSAS